ncbi:hypothetical protein F5878DRAFT_83059 [Lentinula raphanica]|uniref:Uncharacterized protein n=1 Tax=Lentinula raphanica TaxID=153919 RepID=A0AA38PC15_9AGAR|nr:hypothetical protein F5880DRAFT_1272518 [Lentinula raphanica]KAJ3840138.1 hypothetical protein F5878DRAFT_83059 [Lentinula raphanica]
MSLVIHPGHAFISSPLRRSLLISLHPRQEHRGTGRLEYHMCSGSGFEAVILILKTSTSLHQKNFSFVKEIHSELNLWVCDIRVGSRTMEKIQDESIMHCTVTPHNTSGPTPSHSPGSPSSSSLHPRSTVVHHQSNFPTLCHGMELRLGVRVEGNGVRLKDEGREILVVRTIGDRILTTHSMMANRRWLNPRRRLLCILGRYPNI